MEMADIIMIFIISLSGNKDFNDTLKLLAIYLRKIKLYTIVDKVCTAVTRSGLLNNFTHKYSVGTNNINAHIKTLE